eukprot:COSAG01_NODE_6102_length_3849_cov_17.469333_3_plen_120_part_00
MLAAWKDTSHSEEAVDAFWRRWCGQLFHVHVPSDLSLPDPDEVPLSRSRTLSVNSYPGEEVSTMFHGTSTAAAQVCASTLCVCVCVCVCVCACVLIHPERLADHRHQSALPPQRGRAAG